MRNMYVIDIVDASNNGPMSIGPSGKSQIVHLHQGAVDGACGLYCLFMSLSILGLVDRDMLRNLSYDKRTAIGKIMQRIDALPGLIVDGTDLDDLRKILQGAFSKQISIEGFNHSGSKVRDFVELHIEKNHPVILGLEFGNGGHWVVVIGLEYFVDEDGNKKLNKFLILDPDAPISEVCAWNGVINASGSGGKYPYFWWKADRKVGLDQAIAIYRK